MNILKQDYLPVHRPRGGKGEGGDLIGGQQRIWVVVVSLGGQGFLSFLEIVYTPVVGGPSCLIYFGLKM